MNRTNLVSAAAALLAGVTLAAAAVSPAAASTNDPAKPKAKQEQPAPKADARKYCIDTEATGSRMPKRVCRTRAEWLAIDVDPLELMKQQR